MPPPKPLARSAVDGDGTSAASSEMEVKRKRRKRPSEAYHAMERQDYERLALALKTFFAHTGHFVVPLHFEVPLDPLVVNGFHRSKDIYIINGLAANQLFWPKDTRGLRLGRTVFNVTRFARNLAARSEEFRRQVKPLEAIGFPLYKWREYKWIMVVLPGLTIFKSIFGHLAVEFTFVVPTNDRRWLPSTWGACLGSMVARLREKRDKLSKAELEQLQQLGFGWDAHEVKWNQRIFPALKQYKRKFGDTRVPFSFVIPEDDVSWTNAVRGLRLGRYVSAIRKDRGYRSVPNVVQQLDQELGFEWELAKTRVVSTGKSVVEGNAARFVDVILPALETFKQVFGHTYIPLEFVVPSEAPWPEPTWGVRIGRACKLIRDNGSYARERATHQARWDALDLEM